MKLQSKLWVNGLIFCILVNLIIIPCIGCKSNVLKFKNTYPKVSNQLDTLFHFMENGEFDSLYNHFSDSMKNATPKDAFLAKEHNISYAAKFKNFKVIKCQIKDDSTFKIYFSDDMYSPPNAYKLNYSWNSDANKFQFRKHDYPIWNIAWRNKMLYFSPIDRRKKHPK